MHTEELIFKTTVAKAKHLAAHAAATSNLTPTSTTPGLAPLVNDPLDHLSSSIIVYLSSSGIPLIPDDRMYRK